MSVRLQRTKKVALYNIIMSENILRKIINFFPGYINFICSDLEKRERLSQQDKILISRIVLYLKTNSRGRPPKVPEHIEFMLRESVG